MLKLAWFDRWARLRALAAVAIGCALSTACGAAKRSAGEVARTPDEPGTASAGDGASGSSGGMHGAGAGGASGAGRDRDAGATDPDGGTPEPRDAGMPADGGAATPRVSAPERVGTLVGPGASPLPAGVRVYGADLGLTYEHDGKLFMLFGDTWPTADFICNDLPEQDDSIATLPNAYPGSAPQLSFASDPESLEVRRVTVLRGETALDTGALQAPLAAFSDGQRAFALFARVKPVTCGDGQPGADWCTPAAGLECSDALGVCEPAATRITLVCDRATSSGCLPGQACVAGAPLCVDPGSSQHDGSTAGAMASVVQEVEIGVQRKDDPATFDSVHMFPSAKFSSPTARTVARFSGQHAGSDYGPGDGDLLVWGRPGWFAEHGRESQLYLLKHRLPLPVDGDGALHWQPQYFAGLDSHSGEPIWSDAQKDALPLALDGRPGGDPHEEMQIVGTMTVSWLGAPLNKWMMLYGGDMSDMLLQDAAHARLRSPGAIMMRFADHPWGPWSAPVPHLSPGHPTVAGEPYGPGGMLYHPECSDAPEYACVQSDPYRPTDIALPGCPVSAAALDPGRLYAPNVIESYTQPNADGGLDVYWNLSTWNPYTVVLMKTSIAPGEDQGEGLETASLHALERMSDWRSLPVLSSELERYVQQTSRDRGSDDASFPLSGNGNRDFNNFICASREAQLGALQTAPLHFDQTTCEEDYVRGAVMARFTGSGRLVRTWIGMTSLLFVGADDEVFRIYVDDDPTPVIEVPLAEALDGSAGEIFAPPFGAGSPRRLAWYYPVSFEHKLIVALDNLGDYDEYYFHCDAALDRAPRPLRRAIGRLAQRDRAIAQLSAVYRPAGRLSRLGDVEPIALEPGAEHTVSRDGPATIQELRLRTASADLADLAGVRVRVRWDGADEAAIDVPLLELFAAERVPPERSGLALTSFAEAGRQTLALKLPMPFASSAELAFENSGSAAVEFEIELAGEPRAPGVRYGHLHVQRRETVAPSDGTTHHVGADVRGRGRLVGVCASLQGLPDDYGGYQYDPLNLLEGDVQVRIDGALALDGTGTEEYADDVFYFTDAPQAGPFVQAWGLVNDVFQSLIGEASFCRWHVLGTELDFESRLELTFELGGAGNPEIARRHRSLAFYYVAD